MSFYEATALVLSFGALISVAISVRTLRAQVKVMGEQTNHFRQTLEVSSASSVDALLLCVTQAYLEYPELRPVFNEQDEQQGAGRELDEATTYRAMALAEVLADTIERVFSLQELAYPGDVSASLLQWSEDSLRDSSFLRSWLGQHRAWCSASVLSLLDRIETERTASVDEQVESG